jgi:hypothetical protein
MSLLVCLVLLQSEPVLWLKENPGFTSQEVYEQLTKNPRFVLYGDGTVVYRNDKREYFRVKLSDEEKKVLLKSVEDKGFMKMKPPPPQGPIADDSASETLGMKLGNQKNELTFPCDLNAKHKDLKWIRDQLYSYRHDKAEKIEKP